MEEGRRIEEDSARENTNKWERVIKNCDMKSSLSPGGRDLSRMKTAMLNRRNDMQGDAAGQSNFGNFWLWTKWLIHYLNLSSMK